MSADYAVGNRVANYASWRVGTITVAWDTACLVKWDRPRSPQKPETYELYKYLEHASEYQERMNAYQLWKEANQSPE